MTNLSLIYAITYPNLPDRIIPVEEFMQIAQDLCWPTRVDKSKLNEIINVAKVEGIIAIFEDTKCRLIAPRRFLN